MNKFVHGLILAFYALCCSFVWALLTMMSYAGKGDPLPAFTRLCIGLRSFIFILPILAALYCLYIWFRKSSEQRPWINFFAVTLSSLFLITMPTLIACYLPLVVMLERTAVK